MSTIARSRVLPGRFSGRAVAPHVRRRNVIGFSLAVPALVLFGVFAIYPIIQVFVLSFFDYNLTSTPRFVGLDNYVYLSSDPRFLQALGQTAFYAVGTYLPALVLALLLAQALAAKTRGLGLVRLLYFLPNGAI